MALCRSFEFFWPVKPVSEAQELLNHVQRASIVAGVCGANFTQITLKGSIPPPMAASGRFLGLDPAHGQNGLETVKKL